jgi:translation initiation factor IF-2
MVVLVVAADDGVMPQTIEAISHAKAANVPLIVAINKIDKPGVKPDRVRQELLQHEIVVESLGGETQEIEVSATQKLNLDKLLEAITLQAEILDLRANPDRSAEGTGDREQARPRPRPGGHHPGAEGHAEAGRHRRGRRRMGPGARDARRQGARHEGCRAVAAGGGPRPAPACRARARPSSPSRTRPGARDQRVPPAARRARSVVAAHRREPRLPQRACWPASRRASRRRSAVVVKADVQGSAEAIGVTPRPRSATRRCAVRVLHSGVGPDHGSDIQLAKASERRGVAFNVRATAQARELRSAMRWRSATTRSSTRSADDIEELVRGKLAPIQREKFLGYAQILQVFEVKRIGNVAGCRVTEGVVRRGAGVRLLRDGVVIHQGELSTLRRFKDDVKEVTSATSAAWASRTTTTSASATRSSATRRRRSRPSCSRPILGSSVRGRGRFGPRPLA